MIPLDPSFEEGRGDTRDPLLASTQVWRYPKTYFSTQV